MIRGFLNVRVTMSEPSPEKKNAPEKENTGDKATKTGTASHRVVLRKISRARTRLIVCFWTLPVYIVAIWVLLDNGGNIALLMWIYMALYAGFAVDMATRRCPDCGNQFFVKTILLNLITSQCQHCGLALKPSR